MARAHLWIGPTPEPTPGQQAVCGYVFAEPFTPAAPDDPRCVRCLELAPAWTAQCAPR